MSLCILNIGRTKSGKTTRTINIAKSLRLSRIIVNDVQHESKYKAEIGILKYYGDREGFLEKVKQSKNTVVIFEEATMYFPHSAGYGGITDLLLSKRFSGNAYILNFHALRQVPDYILDYTDYMYIGKSKGNIERLSKKFEDYPEVIEAWRQSGESENRYEFFEVKF